MKTVKLGDVCDFKAQANSKLLPYIGMEDVESNTGKFLGSTVPRAVKSSTSYFDNTCVLYGKLRPYLNKVFVPDFDGHCSTEFLAIRPDLKRLDRKYLWHFLISPKTVDALNGYTTGTRMPRADINILKSLEISLPSLEQQRRVVERLDAAFEKIDRAIELTEKNIKQSELLFSGGIEQIFSNQNMANWKSYKVKEIGNVQTGTTPKTSIKENYGNYIPFIKPGDFRVDGSLNYENDALSKNGLKVGRFIPKNSVLMVCIGATITKTAVTTRDVSCNQQINAVSLPDATTAKFVYYQMITKKFKEKILNEAPKTTLPIINKGNWSALTVGFPETTEIENVVKNLDSLLNVSINLSEMYKNKLYKLSELKKSLLTQAFEQGGVK